MIHRQRLQYYRFIIGRKLSLELLILHINNSTSPMAMNYNHSLVEAVELLNRAQGYEVPSGRKHK